MFKELIAALICVVTFSAAAHISHGDPVKKQAVYQGYVPPYNAYQGSQYYSTSYPQGQVSPVAQSQSQQSASNSAGVPVTSVKQSAVPQKVTGYPPVVNSVPAQYPYPFKQYYPQIYPQNSQYPSVPSVFYVPSQGRFPTTFNEGTANTEQGASSGTTGSSGGSVPGSWYPNNWNQNLPNWPAQAPQFPQFPQYPSGFPQFPANLPQYPANLPQFPSQLPQFPAGSFPTGNFPSFPGSTSPGSSAPAGASPAAVPSNEAGAGTTTNAEGNSVVVVGARRPEKIENADSNVEGVKNEGEKVAADFPPQQYILLGQPQYVLQNGGQIPVAQNAGGKDPVQLDTAAKGAVSSFLFQPQPVLAQQAQVSHQFPQIPQNKIFTPQEFQELIQQVQISNKKLLETNNAVPQFYVQQGVVPQQGVVQAINGVKGQDVPSQQVSNSVPQPYLIQGFPSVAQVQQPYLQYSPQQQQQQQQQLFVPQYASLPQQKPFVDVSNVPGASSAYQRFLLESQKPIKSTVVGVQNVEGGAALASVGPTPVSIPTSVSSTVSANDSSSSPEPSNHEETDSTGNTSVSETKNGANELPVADDISQNIIPSSEGYTSSLETTTKSNNEGQNFEFGARLNIAKPSSS